MKTYTCRICNATMNDETTNDYWPCCTQECEHLFFDLLYKTEQDMQDVILTSLERDW